MRTLIIILIIIIIVVAWYLFRPEKFFISKRVNEVFPDVKENDSSSKNAIKFRNQELHGVAHDATGTATVYELPTGKCFFCHFENFAFAQYKLSKNS